jgi:predicted CxxxxCH...CXXCH cytochrome family protein
VQVGSDCNGCHRSAPFGNLAGSTLTGDLVVGAHEAHLTGASRLRGPIACTECHRVPQVTGDAGHIDTALPAEVFPPGSGALARTDGAQPAWDRATATCTNSYCHGGGAKLAGDTSLGLQRAPDWTSNDQAYCGACHGIPPTSHAQSLDLGDCATCHPSVDGFGNPLFDAAGASRHLDGVIDVN